jgi:hypothetical protein
MTEHSNSPAQTASSFRFSWSWVWLGLALVWVGLIRVPLVLNARAHLDSDLAVDGLTLLDAVNGHWRWHYPATPFIGTPPVLLSIVQAKIWGTTPITLVSGGVVAWGLVVGLAFWLNLRAFGPSAASWGLVPLAFASTGAIWLSGRITGGHLPAVAWHAGAFALLWGCLALGGWRRALILGLWCGFGLYIDTMFAVTWVGLGVASVVGWWGLRVGFGRVLLGLLVFGFGAGLGVAPRVIGQRVDPYDAYVGQFTPTFRGDILARNGKLLVCDCLPRLIAGHRLPGLESEPDPKTLAGVSKTIRPKDQGLPWFALTVVVVSLGCFGWSLLELVVGSSRKTAPTADLSQIAASRGVGWGLVASSLVVVGGFLVSPNLSNSDNYRYLVFLLVAGSSGFGLWLARMAARSYQGLAIAWALALGFAGLMTVDSARWYAGFGWIDDSWRPIRREVADPALDWLDVNLRFSMILGNYWDVYRLSFLTQGRVFPVPFPQYPDRFPQIKRTMVAGRYRAIIVRADPFGPEYRARAMALGAPEFYRGEGLWIVDWPEGLRP